MLGKWFADLDYPMGVMHDPRYVDTAHMTSQS